MDKIKKLIIFSLTLILCLNFTSQAYALPFNQIGRAILNGLKNVAKETIENTFGQTKRIIKPGNKNPWKQSLESLGQRTE